MNSVMTLPSDFVYIEEIEPTIRQSIRYVTHQSCVGHPIVGYKKGGVFLAYKSVTQVNGDIID
jgi:D-alanyl-D-alanine dipeptidase